MKFKLDENFGVRIQNLFRPSGYNVSTVREEGLGGKTDAEIFTTCCKESFCLVSLDKDFLDVLRFPPQEAGGIVVLRLPKNPSLQLLEQLINEFLPMVDREPIKGRLWVVEPGRIRVHQSEFDESGDT